MKKKLLWVLCTLAMAIALLPGAAYAASDVAQIGDTTYDTLDEAVTAAADGDTITVLADCETAGLNLSKDLTIKGAENVNPTITFNTYGIALWGKELTFEDCTVEMNNITSTPYTGEWNWMAICASTNASLTLKNVDMSIIAESTSTNNAHCIYFCSNNKLNLTDSTLTIKNYNQDALEWDGGDGGYNVNIVNSTFISDHNRSGFTGTFYTTITDSTVQVVNSLGNGSNGSHFIITNSDIDFSNNTSHGLSAGILQVTDSTITANDNGLTGIIFNNKATFKNSDVTIIGTKGTSYWNAGMRCLSSNASCTIDEDCKFRITDNYVSGIFMDASTSLTIAEGADVVVTGNEAMQKNCSTSKDLAKSGGGIVVRSGATATLSSTTQIYNNHASVAGDDIYLEGSKSSITFSKVGTNWWLNGTYLSGDTHCKHWIDGWYNDGYTDGSASARWEADAESEDDNYISLYENTSSVTATGILALKAAHGVDAVEKKTKTTEPGLDKVIVEDGAEKDQTSANAGDTVSFQLTSTIPDSDKLKECIEYTYTNSGAVGSIKEGSSYTITFHDVMDSALTLNEKSMTVSLVKYTLSEDEKTAVAQEPISLDGYYTIKQSTDITDGCTFEVIVDILALYEDEMITESDFGWASIVVSYDATLSENVKAGAYYNKAWVVYPDGESKEDEVEVDTYGIKVFKYDQDTVDGSDLTTADGLAGAKFELYSDEECKVFVAELVSGADGYVTYEGLAEGTYYLKETEAPEGYVCSSSVVEINVTTENATDYLVTVNFANAGIPSTGGMGTTMYTIAGLCILLAAGMILVISRRRRTL